MRELGSIEAEKIKADNANYFVVHRKDGDIDFVNVLLSELSLLEKTVLVTIGEDNSGQMALIGPADHVQQLGPRFVLTHQSLNSKSLISSVTFPVVS